MLSEGVTAPDFSIPGTAGEGEFSKYRLTDYTDTGAVVLTFYPFDFSPVCTASLCGFRDAEWLAMSENVDVFGVSRDSCYAHERFIDEHRLTFPLLSDVDGTVTERYGVRYDEWEHHKGVPKRAIFVVDTDETIRYAWTTDDAYESPDITELADELASLSAVDVDPADVA